MKTVWKKNIGTYICINKTMMILTVIVRNVLKNYFKMSKNTEHKLFVFWFMVYVYRLTSAKVSKVLSLNSDRYWVHADWVKKIHIPAI